MTVERKRRGPSDGPPPKRAGRESAKPRVTLLEEAKERLGVLKTTGSRVIAKKVENQILLHELQVHQIELEMQNEELQEALREAETARARYTELFEFLPVGIIVVDRRGMIREANLATEIWLGGVRSALAGQNVRFLLSPEDLGSFEKFFERMIETKTRQSVEVRLRSKGPEPLWIQITGIAIEDGLEGEGESERKADREFYLALTDITARMNAERLLARDKEAIERIVEQRSRELLVTQGALEKARRLADIGELAATVAHELRNPLAAITIAAAAMRRKAGATIETYVATIEKKVRESDRIINNLLFYSRLKSPRLERVDLCAALNEVAAEMRSKETSGKHFVVVCKDAAARGLVIEADPTQITEMMSNLLNNAYDAISNGGTIEIETERDGGGHALIRVKDNGIGIASEDLVKIWRPFYSTKSKGTGLGLAVVNQIVTLHGGTVRVDSEPNKGTTVTVRLPLSHKGSGGANGAESA